MHNPIVWAHPVNLIEMVIDKKLIRNFKILIEITMTIFRDLLGTLIE
jgi:hypothetical protein